MKAVGHNVVIEMAERETQVGGIVIPDQFTEPATEGEVTSIGRDVELIAPRDIVGYPSHLGTRVVVCGRDYLIIDYRKLLYLRSLPVAE